jgi:hypothetical protein
MPRCYSNGHNVKNTGGYQERPRKKKRKLVSKKSRGKHTGIDLPVTSAKKTRTM